MRRWQHSRRRRWPTVALAIVGVAALVGAGGILWSIHAYRHHAAVASARLTQQVRAAERRAVRTVQTVPSAQTARAVRTTPPSKPRSCSAPAVSAPAAGNGARMVLTIPAIGLTAPVLSADTEAAMSRGVGHLPTSSWPNQAGTDVLEAHDVTFFAHIDRLRRGDAIYLSAPCHTWRYEVASGGVVHQGTPVAATRAPTLAMVTCWPTDALYFTKQRYVVSARLVGTSLSGPNLKPTPHFSVPGAVLPPGVTPNDVSVNTMGVPEGSLKEAPTLAPALRSSAAALTTMAAATEIFDTGLLSAEKGNAHWWAAVSHGVPISVAQPLSGGPPKWISSVQISLGGSGSSVTSATLAATIGAAGGQYQLTATLVAVGGHWEIGRWVMQRG